MIQRTIGATRRLFRVCGLPVCWEREGGRTDVFRSARGFARNWSPMKRDLLNVAFRSIWAVSRVKREWNTGMMNLMCGGEKIFDTKIFAFQKLILLRIVWTGYRKCGSNEFHFVEILQSFYWYFTLILVLNDDKFINFSLDRRIHIILSRHKYHE